MTAETKADWFKYLDFAFKALPAAASIIIILLSSQFVSRTEFMTTSDKFSGRIDQIEKLLIRMESSAETDRRHDALLADHETRLRALEKMPVEHN
jgi:1-deoxy-D-xylulose 5-phosphate reductoisomerase